MKQEDINTEAILDQLAYIDPRNNDDWDVDFDKKFGCSATVSIEKVNALQYTYYYSLDFSEHGIEETLEIEIESGINNGTQVNSCEWGMPTLVRTREIEVLKDIVLDKEFYRNASVKVKYVAQRNLDRLKPQLFKRERQNNYDNYVTGGNSKMPKVDIGDLILSYIYETEESNRNII